MYGVASSTSDIATAFASIGSLLYYIISPILLGGIALVGVGFAFRKLLNLVWHSDGTTNWLGRHWNWYDHMSYKPYKNYNRFHSRKWNLEHTV